jgi:CTP synthase
MVNSGLVIGAVNQEEDLIDCVEWPDAGMHKHPWGLGINAHPEFKSKPTAANPLFRDFITASRNVKNSKNQV